MTTVKSCVPVLEADVARAAERASAAAETVQHAAELVARGEGEVDRRTSMLERVYGRVTGEGRAAMLERALVRPAVENLRDARDQLARRNVEENAARTNLRDAQSAEGEGLEPDSCPVTESTAAQLHRDPGTVAGLALPTRPLEPMSYNGLPLTTYRAR